MQIKYTLILILLLSRLSIFSIGQTHSPDPYHKVDDGVLEDFLTYCLSFNNTRDSDALMDTLFYTMQQLGYQETTDGFLWDIYARARQTNKDVFISKSLAMLLFWYHYNNKYQDILFFTDSILKYNHAIRRDDSIQLYNSRARAFLNLEIYNASLYNIMYMDTLMARMDSRAKKELQIVFPISFATLCFDMGLYEEAIVATKTRIDEILSIDSTANIASYYNNIGVAWKSLNEPDSAVHYFDLPIQVMFDHPQEIDSFFFHLVEGNLGSALLLNKKYDTALNLILKDVQSSKKLKKDEGYRSAIASQLTLTNYYLSNDKPLEALNMLDSILKHISLLTYNYTNPKYYQLRSKAFHALGNLDSAYFYLNKYTLLNDSIALAEKESGLINLQTALEVYKKEYMFDDQKKQLISEKAKTQKQQYVVLASFLLLGFVLIILYIILQSRHRQQRTNLQLKQQNEKIAAQAKNLVELSAFKETMASMIAHDLKTPLNTLINLPVQQGIVDNMQIKQAGINMLNTVMNLLDVHKYKNTIMPLDNENKQAKIIVDSAVERLRLLADSKFIDIQNRVSDELFVFADIEIVERIFENLLTNAIKFSPVNETIIITGENTGNKQIKFRVIDSGVGLNKKDMDRVFEKYYQAEVRSSGNIKSSGLGLSFCKMAVETHGGQIGVEPATDKGSVFWFTVNQGKPTAHIETDPSLHNPLTAAMDLTEKDKVNAQIILDRLLHLEYYEFSKIRKVLNSDNAISSEGIRPWREDMLRAIKSGNKEKYEELMQTLKKFSDGI